MTLRLRKSTMMDYKNVMPNRKLFMRGGVFPYAIHANFVSKSKRSMKNISNKSDKKTKCSRQRHNVNSPKNRTTNFKRAFQSQEEETSSVNDVDDEFANIDDLATTFCSFSPRIRAKEVTNKKKLKSSFYPETETNKFALIEKQHCATANPKKLSKTSAEIKINQILKNCIYKDVGETLNKEFIMLSEEFECSLDMTSSIRNKLLNFRNERLKEECDSDSSSSSPIQFVDEMVNINGSNFYGDLKSADKNIRKIEENVEPKFVNDITKVLEDDEPTLSLVEGNRKIKQCRGNDKKNYLFTRLKDNNCIGHVSSSSSDFDLENNKCDLNRIASWNSRNREENSQQFIKDTDKMESSSSVECIDFEDEDFFEYPSKSDTTRLTEIQTNSKNSFRFDSVVAKRGMDEINEKLLNPMEFLDKGIDEIENPKCNEKNGFNLIKHKPVKFPITDFKSSFASKSSECYSNSAVGKMNGRRKKQKILFQLNPEKGKRGNWLKMSRPIF